MVAAGCVMLGFEVEAASRVDWTKDLLPELMAVNEDIVAKVNRSLVVHKLHPQVKEAH